MSGAPEDRKQGQGQPNLNTIYEEFDLGDRIKALKGKHIKIKKLVKKEDGNYSIRESSLYADKSVDVSGLSPAQAGGADFGYTSSSNILPQESMVGHWSSQIQEKTSPILSGHNALGLGNSAESSASNLFAKKNYDSKYFALNGATTEPSHSTNTFKKEPVMVSSGAFNFASQSPGSRIEPFIPKPELKQAVSYELGNDFFTSPSKIMFAGEPLGVKRDLSVPKKPTGVQSGYFGQGGGQKSARSKASNGVAAFAPNQAMYTSNLLDFGSKREGLKSSSNIGSQNMATNIMFGFPKTNGASSSTNLMKTSTYNDMPLSQYYDTILNNRIESSAGSGMGLASASQGRNSLMFRSQSLQRSSSGGIGIQGTNKSGSPLNPAQREFKAFTLPPEVTKFLEEEPIRVKDLENKIALEKAKLDSVLDEVLKDITTLIENKRKALHRSIDAFMGQYKTNKEIFESQFRSFKDTRGILGTNKFGGSGDRLINLESIEYHDLHGKTKEEACKMTLRLASLTKEIERRLLTHYSNLMEKDLCHAPNLSDTETAKEYMRDMHRDIVAKVSSDLEILDSLVYTPEVFDFSNIKIKPHFRPALGESKTNVIYNVGNLVSQKVVDRLQVEYISMGTGLDKVSCLHVVEEDLLATGHGDNSIAIWSMNKGIKSATLKDHKTAVTALGSIKAYFAEISSSTDQPDPLAEASVTRSQLVTESQYIPSPGAKSIQSPSAANNNFLKHRNTKQQNFLISGSEGPEADIIVWDLLSHTKLRVLQGHKDTVTSLITLRDGHTLISGSLDCNLLIWDVASETPAQMATESSEVYCMHAFNDFSHFITGCKSGEMNIYRITYAYNKKYERATFESCKKIKTVRSSLPIFCLNESLLRENTVFSGGADRSVVVWNTVTCAEKTKFTAHQTDVVGCVLLENPLKNQSNSFVLSFGNYEDKMVITDTFSGESREVVLDQNVSLSAGRFSNPNLQLMPVTDVFGKSQTYLLVAGTRHGLPCLLKVLIPQDEEDHQLDDNH